MANNQLTHPQSYKLAKWVEANAEQCKYMTHGEVADKATQEIGFPVSLSNIASARKMTGIIWIGRRGSPVGSRGASKNRDRIEVIARELIGLMRELGYEPPPSLDSIAHHRPVK